MDNEVIMLEIVDTAGQEDFSILKDQFLKIGRGFMLVYSIVQKSSWLQIQRERELVLRAKECDSFPMVIVVTSFLTIICLALKLIFL